MKGDTTDIVERDPSLDSDGRAAYRVNTDGRGLTATIVGAVAEVADCDPVSEGFRLYDVVDPEALERLFPDDAADGRVVGTVTFELRGCRVEVHSDGEHVVYAPEEAHHDSHSPSVGSA
ncbi:hypothetical protein NGM10_16295 (plasmid) [Halorussus salilacus]|uniref:HalOD1 output domain-containing protein n=1 Tax=Halorussus salilacus TaxID=2953750 RepID=UPI0020A05D6A|nr:HalOD1 output domain-containing protein [Halorussus salilacus]USZ69963.1 hypothetical protein NGM10_16295 [Halorussus salilacus]